MSFRLHEDRIAVKAGEAEEVSKSGLILSEGAQNPWIFSEVVLVGPGRRNEAGELVEMDFTAGDEVMHHIHAGQPTEVDGTEYRILRPGDIVGVKTTELKSV